ncbi:MAG TPA: hypothetical protein VEY12_02340 [Thermoplasmata archaeon]|nr:hypothetical protein [Thermoplasmata archaeon]
MPKAKTWWRLKKIRHRDAVVLSVVSSALLLAGQVPYQQQLYQQYLLPVTGEPLVFFFDTSLLVLAYMSYFAGILVLEGGVNFLWGQVGRGRFLVSLGVGLSLISLLKQFAFAVLTTGSPFAAVTYFTTSLAGLGLITGFATYALMHEYALMLKKHARNMWRQWRRTKRPQPARRRTRSSATSRN